MKEIIYALDRPPKDSIAERLDKESVTKKYWFNMGISIVILLITCIISAVTIVKSSTPKVPYTMAVNIKQNKGYEITTLPYPHQSFKNVSGWLFDAIMLSYSFNFNNYYSQVEKSSYFFTPQGYDMYLKALTASKIETDIMLKKLDITTVPLQEPVLINSGVFSSTEFWRFRVPVLVSYYGGKTPVIQKQLIEVLILRVPAHNNPKGLSISEFNMIPL